MNLPLFGIYKKKSAVSDKISIPSEIAIVDKFDEVLALALTEPHNDSRHFAALSHLATWGEAFSLGETAEQPETFTTPSNKTQFTL